MMPARKLAICAAVFAALAVAAGAFGAHVLRDSLEPRLLEAFKTGAQYHLVHAVGALVLAVLAPRVQGLRIAGWLLIAGIVLFSGSLYALALSGIGALGAITPLGGVCFIGGWLLAAVALYRQSEN